MSITWVDDVTPVDAANLNQLEQITRKNQPSGYLGLNAAGDGFVLGGDANLARVAPGVLRTTGQYQAFQGAAASTVFGAAVTGDGNLRFLIQADGKAWWGSGAGGLDTSLYRSAAGTLKTDGNFFATAALVSGLGGAGQVQITAGANPTILFGPAGDTSLYRAVAGRLKTDGDFAVGPTGNPAAWTTGASLSATGAHLAVGATPTSTAFYAGVNGDGQSRILITADGKIQWGPGNAAVDTALYRFAAATLKTDGHLYAVQQLVANLGTANQVALGHNGASVAAGLYFGNAADVNLYRYGAGKLASNGMLYADLGKAGEVRIGDNGGGLPAIWFGPGASNYIYSPSNLLLATQGQFYAGALRIPYKLGTPVDADVPGGIADLGYLIWDATTGRLWIRDGGNVWRYVQFT